MLGMEIIENQVTDGLPYHEAPWKITILWLLLLLLLCPLFFLRLELLVKLFCCGSNFSSSR